MRWHYIQLLLYLPVVYHFVSQITCKDEVHTMPCHSRHFQATLRQLLHCMQREHCDSTRNNLLVATHYPLETNETAEMWPNYRLWDCLELVVCKLPRVTWHLPCTYLQRCELHSNKQTNRLSPHNTTNRCVSWIDVRWIGSMQYGRLLRRWWQQT